MNTNSFFLKRNSAIDMLRALTMFTMIFVNDFWKIQNVPRILEHAKFGEDFMGLADVVFPLFLFVVGMSIPYALENRYHKGYSLESTLKHILSRTLALLIMGAFITNSEYRMSNASFYSIGVYWIVMAVAFVGIWNQYPKDVEPKRKMQINGFRVAGAIALFFLAITFRSKTGVVFGLHWGILGAIGWVYLLASLIYILNREKKINILFIFIILFFLNMFLTPLNLNFGGNPILQHPVDNFLDGFLNTIQVGDGALLACTLGGVLFSLLLSNYDSLIGKKGRIQLFLLACLILLIGFIAHHFWIVSKLLATPTWLLYIFGIAIGLYLTLDWLIEHNYTKWFNYIKPAGTATLTVYIIPYVYYGFADITGVVLPNLVTNGYVGLLNCIIFAFVVIGTTAILGRLNIKLKI